ncbi:MAG: phosphatase PAP2 family protein [Alphaproteobacteria bacterium]
MLSRTELLACFALFGLGVVLWVSGADAALTQWLNTHQSPALVEFWHIFGGLGLGRFQLFLCLGVAWWLVRKNATWYTPITLFLGAFWLWLRVLVLNPTPVTTSRHILEKSAIYVQNLPHAARAWVMVLPIMFGAGALGLLLKMLIGRARPKMMLWHNMAEYWTWGPAFSAKFWSFPSGHTVSTFALVAVICTAFPRYRVLAWGVGLALALARTLAVTPHYLGDVCAGIAIGYGVGIYLARRYALAKV